MNNRAAASKELVKEEKKGNGKGNEDSEDSNKAATSKELIKEDKKGNGKGNEENEDSIKAAASKDIEEEYKEGNEEIEEALKKSDTEDVDSIKLSPPMNDSKYYLAPFFVLIVI